MISKREIRKIIEKYWDMDISDNTLETIKNDCKIYTEDLIKDLVDNFKENNRVRKLSGLRELKKLKPNIYKSLSGKVNKQTVDVLTDVRGQANSETLISDKQQIEVA
jgi:hypothetical protein